MGVILVVDDEDEIREMIIKCLKREMLEGVGCKDAQEAISYISQKAEAVQLMILDIMMPGMDGYELLQNVRKTNETLPVILLSARQEEYDKILGLGLGADDYVTKPFSPGELMARVKVQLRKYKKQEESPKKILSYNEIKLDLTSCIVTKNDTVIELAGKEYWLLKFFMEHQGQVFTKAQIYHGVWDANFEDDNTVMVYISHLREKLENEPKTPKLIQTIRGIGYRFGNSY